MGVINREPTITSRPIQAPQKQPGSDEGAYINSCNTLGGRTTTLRRSSAKENPFYLMENTRMLNVWNKWLFLNLPSRSVFYWITISTPTLFQLLSAKFTLFWFWSQPIRTRETDIQKWLWRWRLNNEDVNDHRNYESYLSSSENEAWKYNLGFCLCAWFFFSQHFIHFPPASFPLLCSYFSFSFISESFSSIILFLLYFFPSFSWHFKLCLWLTFFLLIPILFYLLVFQYLPCPQPGG